MCRCGICRRCSSVDYKASVLHHQQPFRKVFSSTQQVLWKSSSILRQATSKNPLRFLAKHSAAQIRDVPERSFKGRILNFFFQFLNICALRLIQISLRTSKKNRRKIYLKKSDLCNLFEEDKKWFRKCSRKMELLSSSNWATAAQRNTIVTTHTSKLGLLRDSLSQRFSVGWPDSFFCRSQLLFFWPSAAVTCIGRCPEISTSNWFGI